MGETGDLEDIRTVSEIPEYRSGAISDPRFKEDKIRFSDNERSVRTVNPDGNLRLGGRAGSGANQESNKHNSIPEKQNQMYFPVRNDGFEGLMEDNGGLTTKEAGLNRKSGCLDPESGSSDHKSVYSNGINGHLSWDNDYLNGYKGDSAPYEETSDLTGETSALRDLKKYADAKGWVRSNHGRTNREEDSYGRRINEKGMKLQRGQAGQWNSGNNRLRTKMKRAVSAPIRMAVGSIKESATGYGENAGGLSDGYSGSGQSSGMNGYDLARDTLSEKRRMTDRLQELLRMVVRVVKVIASTTILPLAALLALIALIVASVVSFFTGAEARSGTRIPNPTTERQVIYNGLLEEFEGNRIATIGVLCALMAESGCHANATEGKGTWGLTAEEYTEKVNDGTISEEEFINSTYDGVSAGRGYGIAQWSTVDRKKGLYRRAGSWAAEHGADFDIADIDMQVDHLRKTIQDSYSELKAKLIEETDIEDACYLWISTYELPSQKNNTYREKAERNVRLYADSIQEECSYDMDRGNILWPVPSVKIGSVTSKFGYRGNIGVPGATSDHKGIDIGAAEGSNIVAVASGTVKTVAYNSARGNYVVIDHGGGKETWYQHMKTTALVKQGESVSAGTLLGYVGQTGISKGAHLHFEVHIGGTPVDPLQYYQ